ncbi:MAG: glycosyltransferase family 4 protein [Chitinophagaceae bacterium]
MKRLLQKFSSFLLRLHQYLDRRYNKISSSLPALYEPRSSEGKTKVVHVNGNFVVGGSSQLIADIIAKTAGNYHHRVIVPAHPHPLPYEGVPVYCFSLGEMTALFDYLEKERPALVHIHYWVRHIHRFADFALWYQAVFRICEELQLKVIQNINVPTHPYPSPAVAHNVFVSKYVRDEFNNSGVGSSVIHPGSDLVHFKNDAVDPDPGSTIGMVYRLDRDKLNAGAIDVFIAAVKKNPVIKCYIIGDGYYFKEYKKRVKEEGLEANFVFTGNISYEQLPEYYKKIAVFVTPVHDESFGQVTPFAMGMGIPVAGYDTGALPEILGSKETLVSYGNADALSDLLVELLSDPARRTALGKRNRERAHAYFSVEQMINAYEKLYTAHTAEKA